MDKHSVFLTPQAAEELGDIAKLWTKEGELGVSYLLCKSADTDGAFTHLEFEDEIFPGTMHLKIPHHYILAILGGESVSGLGFINNNER